MSRIKVKQISGPGLKLSGYGVKVSTTGDSLDYFNLDELAGKGVLGYYSSGYTVETLDDMHNLDTSKINPGDQVFVSNAVNGRWAQYIASNVTKDSPPKISWTKISDQLSSMSESNTNSVDISFGDQSPITIANIVPSMRITEIKVDVTEAFNGTSSISIGDDTVNQKLLSGDDVDLTQIGSYMVTPSYQYGGDTDTAVKVFLNPGSTKSGKITVSISYI